MAKATSKQAKVKAGKWLTVVYSPVSLFSLKRSDATSMAARTNLVPTPYAIKMALLKVMLESQGAHHIMDFDGWIKQEFTWIRDLEIRVLPPPCLVVNRNGYKLRYYDQTADKADKTRPTMPLQDGFVFREWVHLPDHLTLCCGATDRTADLEVLFSQINYFGKRGCFFQYLPENKQETEQPTVDIDTSSSFTIQPMDDLGEKATFGRINPYSEEKIRLESDRVIKPGLLPLQLVATSARYDLYQRGS
ncbi:hypothetical protein [Leptodesmis sichuanensis]|uniref:hypothetical protein n=1 Tax=Leptodesmis sichuanensis TaxID=2906798 RepID=UPI001F2C06A3|nr:hypothetical protein [Leptodesmis sichuanensis]MCA1992675.1 hypothetical protein [Coleofasciculus sp. S288]UIE40010.1 hypothetical protein KIK02_10960 [Leptodesmis sichuanensis A121]